ncbi:MAG: hypothetical protein QGH20_06805 [Candidatus Latescibacteria bacterium]|jgi:hypothetical protein|nr:hypothetical protein [Candidatus Latescibacterota bacterium]
MAPAHVSELDTTLTIGNNVMPGAKIERLAHISELVETLGNYPVGG